MILIGASVFILVLAISAWWEADIGWLHFFQAWMYAATMALGLRRNRWGYFIGNIRSRFVGLRKHLRDKLFLEWSAATGSVIHTGNLARPDLLIAVPAWFSNLLVIIGCVWAYSRLEEKHASDAVKFLVCFVLTTGFFAADMAIFQPRYLGLFPRMVHPHLPF
ncbi:MAG: hypothetical protein WBC32_17675 [Candidatus Acidiferrales bacterium]